ncbi:MAG TPA: hypothetical protein VG013_42425, partial [Gemmataceae bacterium]|nr:hypothetical protein [Gemmataceae bacterium]
MKSWTQTIVLLVVFVILIGGLAFIWAYLPPKPPDTGDGTPADETSLETGVRLTFPVTKVELDTQFEMNTSGQQDYWFENRNAEPVDVGLDFKNCKCAQVELLT